MDAHFNAYKAKYDLMESHIRTVRRSQYVDSMDIFINLDDVLHIMHRPIVNKEVQLCGIYAKLQFASCIINLLAHYKMWATKMKIRCRVFGIYTKMYNGFKNSIYIANYRKHFSEINDPTNQSYFFVNDAVHYGMPVAHTICDYVDDVYLVDSHYLEPSIVPLYLKESGFADYDWGMIVSRDHYDLQYAYRDKWFFVSPKGDNTRMITRSNMWQYLGDREHITTEHNSSFYHHDLFPLALTVAGNKLRGIPRLQRIGWKTIFQYLDQVTSKETESIQIISSRFMELLQSKGVLMAQIDNNIKTVNIATQTSVMNDIDKTAINDQLKHTNDLEALAQINDQYFSQFPINIPFLTSSAFKKGPFMF